MVMVREEIEKKVINVLTEKSCMDEGEVHPDSSLIDDLGMDSLDAVEAVFEFEEQYGMEIPDDDIRKFTKVKDIVEYISNGLNKDQKK